MASESASNLGIESMPKPRQRRAPWRARCWSTSARCNRTQPARSTPAAAGSITSGRVTSSRSSLAVVPSAAGELVGSGTLPSSPCSPGLGRCVVTSPDSFPATCPSSSSAPACSRLLHACAPFWAAKGASRLQTLMCLACPDSRRHALAVEPEPTRAPVAPLPDKEDPPARQFRRRTSRTPRRRRPVYCPPNRAGPVDRTLTAGRQSGRPPGAPAFPATAFACSVVAPSDPIQRYTHHQRHWNSVVTTLVLHLEVCRRLM